MKTVSVIEERVGYRIRRYDNGIWMASGSGLSGEIHFYPGRKLPCEFMKKVPKVLGGVLDEYADASSFDWSGDYRTIADCIEPKCCMGMFQRGCASVPVTALLSSINAGSKVKGYFSPKDEDGNISVNALFLALMISPEKPELLREELIHALNQHPKNRTHFMADLREGSPFYGSAYASFMRKATPWVLDWIARGGSVAMKEAANLLEKIETKMRELEKSETDFLSSVSEAATAIYEVPTQKSVRDIWLKQQIGRHEKQFRDVRDRLAFAWLPAATRGKNAF